VTPEQERFFRKYPHIAQSERGRAIANRFTYHPPQPGQAELYEQIRAAGLELANLFNAYCPDSDELINAIGYVDQAVMWANAAIARNS
jgi:hypothetical protein